MSYFRNFLYLRNAYYVMRAGECFFHPAGIINNQWEVVFPKMSLTPNGKSTVSQAYLSAKDRGLLNNQAILVTSLIPRAEQTAFIGAEVLGIRFEEQFLRTPQLNGRNFGRLEGKSMDCLRDVWEIDSAKILPSERMVRYNQLQLETPEAVAERLLRLFEHLEGRSGKTFVLNTHGSVTSILWAMLRNIPLREHWQHDHFLLGEMRRLNN